jgi:oligoribonuclease (3'-5' exoribonuclease)
VLSNFFIYNDIQNISIESELYQRIRDGKDLKADMLPPKLYIVESYLLIQQIANETNPAAIETLMEEVEQTRRDYFSYYEYWQNNNQQEEILLLLDDSNEYVTAFYGSYDERFLPLLKEKDQLALQQLVNTEMKILFEQHRDVIVEISDIITASNLAIENEAKEFAREARLLLFSIYVISLFFILGMSFFIFKKVSTIEKKMLTSQQETQSANERLESIVEGLKQFKHSYDNTLASIDGYVISDDIPGLKTYMDEIIGEKNINEMKNYFKLNFIQNPAVAGLIIAKLIESEKLGVDLILKVRSEVSNINMKASHLCDLIGILLDNAMEAACDSAEKEVVLNIDETEDALVFEIKNSISSPPDRTKMFEKGWTTKGENRGFGLWMAKDIISKYDNVVLNSMIDDDSVVQELFVLKNAPDRKTTVFTDVL